MSKAAATAAMTPAIQPMPNATTAMAPAPMAGSTVPRARVSVRSTRAWAARNAMARTGSGGPNPEMNETTPIASAPEAIV